MNLPTNPYILLSYLNTKLRDEYDSLDSLIDDLELNKNELIEKLKSINYEYDEQVNQFK